MNKVILMGRLTRNPDVKYLKKVKKNGTQETTCIAHYTLAIDRRTRQQDGQQTADFIPCVAFGKLGEFAEKYLQQGMKIAISGHIRTGSYINKENKKVYTIDIIIEEQEFTESKKDNKRAGKKFRYEDTGDRFMNIPDGFDEQPPFE